MPREAAVAWAERGRYKDRPEAGAWRSLVAHQTGGLGVAGSNPVAPTILSPSLNNL